MNSDEIWNVLKKLKIETPPDYGVCDKRNFFDEWYLDSKSLRNIAEEQLGVHSTEQRLKNMTRGDINTAAKMYTYLHTCPYDPPLRQWLKYWIIFYNDLFKTQNPNKIILTLNRMMKMNTPQLKDDRIRAEKLFKRVIKLFPLKFEEIQSMLPGDLSNTSYKGNTGTLSLEPEGMPSLLLCIMCSVSVL